jgi:hypothetical protein
MWISSSDVRVFFLGFTYFLQVTHTATLQYKSSLGLTPTLGSSPTLRLTGPRSHERMSYQPINDVFISIAFP